MSDLTGFINEGAGTIKDAVKNAAGDFVKTSANELLDRAEGGSSGVLNKALKHIRGSKQDSGLSEASGISGSGGGSSFMAEEQTDLTGHGSGSANRQHKDMFGEAITGKALLDLSNKMGEIGASVGIPQVPGEGLITKFGNYYKHIKGTGMINSASSFIENNLNNAEEFKTNAVDAVSDAASNIPSSVGPVSSGDLTFAHYEDGAMSELNEALRIGRGYGIDFNLDGGVDRVELAISKAGSQIIKEMRVLQPRLRDIARKRIKPESVGNKESQVNLVQQGYANYTKDFEMFSV
jgi:hypothetical protein